MCGIAGILSKNTSGISTTSIRKMTDVIAHRGPDGDGCWISPNGDVGLGHRRLSIIDLSHEADQPMHYLGRYTIVFNGEIYNYIELKSVLIQQGYQFKTQSDTEVLMALYDRDKEKCLQLLDGMFSFVLYDIVENTAFCARDRFGEKPFFYSYKKGSHFLFGSEMKCLWEAGIPKAVNKQMLFNYLSYNCLENDQDLSETFFEDCTRLEHSHFLKVDMNRLEISISKYYDIDWKNVDHGISVETARNKFNELFSTSVARRLRSDVTVGSSLSGGLDSSLVVCTINELKKGTSQKQNTFSAVFPGFEKDERKYMDYVIAQTNVDPHFVNPTDEEMMKDLEKLNWHQEEPYGSSSIYVQYRVMQLAKEHNVTVLLDGQGADEVLGGYHGYFLSFFNELKKQSPERYKDQYEKYLRLHSGNTINGIVPKGLGDRVRAISPSLVKPVKRLKNLFDQATNPYFSKDFYHSYKQTIYSVPGNHFDTINESLYSTLYKFGLQQLLRYADRNSMAHSREVRLPFLSHELIEFLFTLPCEFKIHDGWTKWIMREASDLLPNEIRWRVDKIGYEPPQKNWMENTRMKQQIRESKEKLVRSGILHKNILNADIKPEASGENNGNSWKYLLLNNILN